MAITLVQSITAVSNAASPTTLTPTFSGGTAVGNLCVLVATATGASPTLTAPNNWTTVLTYNDASLAVAVFIRPNNPGALTAIPFNLTASGGGAVASMYEYSGVVSGLVNQIVANPSSNGTGTTASIALGAQGIQTTDTIMLLVCGRAAATLTPVLDSASNWSASVAPAVSTNGVPNAQQDVFWTESGNAGSLPTFTGTLGASVHWATGFVRLTSINSQKLTATNVGGGAGILVGTFYQGMIGG